MNNDDPQGKREETELLAIAAQTGDEAPFNQLYERVAPAVCAWASLRIPASLSALVSPEDLVQEVWFRAYRKIADFDPSRSFRGWIFGFANRVLYELLRHRALSASGHDEGGFDFGEVPADATTIAQKAARNEGTTALLSVFAGVDEDERKLIALRGIEGLPFDEVARELGVSPDVARKRWERLRRKLQDQEPPEGLLVG